MTELEDALDTILAETSRLEPERVAVDRAAGRFAAEPVRAPISLPLWDQSAMDGYAVRSEDVRMASPNLPAVLEIAEHVAAGQVARQKIGKGRCARVFTGSQLPPGADAVVMQEDTRVTGGDPRKIEVLDPVKPWENIRFEGEDIERDRVILEAGDRLTAGHIALCAAVGLGKIKVRRRPRVAVIATGSELTEPGEVLAPGRIFDSNRYLIAQLVRKAGGEPILKPPVRDSMEALTSVLGASMEEADGLITCGGVSVGDHDLVKPAIQKLGGRLQFWKVRMKPGRPFVYGRLKGRSVFGLPGNPISALVTFVMLVRPALLRMQGATSLELSFREGRLTETVRNPGDRRHFLRVQMDPWGRVKSAGAQGSHRMASLPASNGLVDVPPGGGFPTGSTVKVLLWNQD